MYYKYTKYLIIIAFLFHFGCGAAQDKATISRPKTPVDENLVDLAPGDVIGALWGDVAKVRASALWQAVELLVNGADRSVFKSLRESAVMDPLVQVDEFIVLVTGFAEAPASSLGPGQFITLLKGRFEADKVLAALTEKGWRGYDSGQVPWDTSRFSAVHKAGLGVMAVTKRTIVVATAPNLEKVVALADGSGKPLSDNPAFDGFAVNGTEALVGRLRKDPDARGLGPIKSKMLDFDWETVRGIDARLTLNEGADIQLDLTVESEAAALKIGRDIERFRRSLARNRLLQVFRAAWVFERMTIQSDGAFVTISAALSSADLAEISRLSEELSKLRGLLEGDAPFPGGGAR